VKRWRAVSVDDEPGAHRALGALLAGRDDIDLVGACANVAEADHVLRGGGIDLLFLDIAMPRVDGLAWLRGLAAPPVVVLVTAHADRALEAFELGISDYLLKPVSPERLDRCLHNIGPVLEGRTQGDRDAARSLALRVGTGARLIDPRMIDRVEAEGNFSRVHFGGQALLVSEPMKSLAERLTPFGFVRLHKSHLANLARIARVGAGEVGLDNGETIPVGRAYRDALTFAIPARTRR
jgi:DNA-binding LytR/AlgR family response regulator